MNVFMTNEIQNCGRHMLLDEIITDFQEQTDKTSLDLLHSKADQRKSLVMLEQLVTTLTFCGGLYEVKTFSFIYILF